MQILTSNSRRLAGGLALALTLVFAACNPIKALNWGTDSTAYTTTPNIVYRAGPRGSFDLYLPKGGAKPGYPLVFWQYGGSWSGGDKNDYAFVGALLASHGYATVVADYRVYPQVKFPVFLSDGARALKAAMELPELKNAKHVVTMGHSAGAYNAAMLAYDTPRLLEAGVPSGTVTGFIGLAGPYDFYPYDLDLTRNVFGHEQNPNVTQPVRLVKRGAPPALLIHGLKDTTVLPRNSRNLQKALQAVGTSATLVELPSKNHYTLAIGLSPIGEADTVVTPILDFLKTRQTP